MAVILDEIDTEIQAALGQKQLRHTWVIPLMVIMVVGATIYLAVLERQIEYVYSLAIGCFGYYFGNITQRSSTPTKTPETPLNGVEELTE